jgi:hypothetical protein
MKNHTGTVSQLLSSCLVFDGEAVILGALRKRDEYVMVMVLVYLLSFVILHM